MTRLAWLVLTLPPVLAAIPTSYDDPEALLRQADAAFDEGRMDRAAELYERAGVRTTEPSAIRHVSSTTVRCSCIVSIVILRPSRTAPSQALCAVNSCAAAVPPPRTSLPLYAPACRRACGNGNHTDFR